MEITNPVEHNVKTLRNNLKPNGLGGHNQQMHYWTPREEMWAQKYSLKK